MSRHISIGRVKSQLDILGPAANEAEVLRRFIRCLNRPQTKTSMLDLLDTGHGNRLPAPVTPEEASISTHGRTLLQVAQFLRRELPVRFAHRARDLDKLDISEGLSGTKGIKTVIGWYEQSFRELVSLPVPTTLEDEAGFAKAVGTILHRHADTNVQIARGLSELRRRVPHTFSQSRPNNDRTHSRTNVCMHANTCTQLSAHGSWSCVDPRREAGLTYEELADRKEVCPTYRWGDVACCTLSLARCTHCVAAAVLSMLHAAAGRRDPIDCAFLGRHGAACHVVFLSVASCLSHVARCTACATVAAARRHRPLLPRPHRHPRAHRPLPRPARAEGRWVPRVPREPSSGSTRHRHSNK